MMFFVLTMITSFAKVRNYLEKAHKYLPKYALKIAKIKLFDSNTLTLYTNNCIILFIFIIQTSQCKINIIDIF